MLHVFYPLSLRFTLHVFYPLCLRFTLHIFYPSCFPCFPCPKIHFTLHVFYPLWHPCFPCPWIRVSDTCFPSSQSFKTLHIKIIKRYILDLILYYLRTFFMTWHAQKCQFDKNQPTIKNKKESRKNLPPIQYTNSSMLDTLILTYNQKSCYIIHLIHLS